SCGGGGDRFWESGACEGSAGAPMAGNGTTYDVVRGLVSHLLDSAGFGDAVCVSNDQTSASYADIDEPPVGDAFYYLVRGQNACGTGGWGKGVGGVARSIASCP